MPKNKAAKINETKLRVYEVDSGNPSANNIELLGPLAILVDSMKSLPGRGWNMITLPFATEPASKLNCGLLLKQYDEKLDFLKIDGPVPNRGIRKLTSIDSSQTDKPPRALDYTQSINQIAVDDSFESDQLGVICGAIHHARELWLHITNENTNNIEIARLGTVPHEDSFLALGTSLTSDGPPNIPNISGLPIGVGQNLDSGYLSSYKHYSDSLFEGLFDPTTPNELLKEANRAVNIVRTTTLEVSTAIETAGIANIPFTVKKLTLLT